MLVCPQCQFENPNTNKFCQRCGTSLTHKNCYECGTQVPINAETCHNCGAFTGTVWCALISPDPDSSSPRARESATELETSNLVSMNTESAEALPTERSLSTKEALSQTETSSPTQPKTAKDSASDQHNDDAEATPAITETVEENATPLPSNSLTSDEPLKATDYREGTLNRIPTPEVVYLDKQQRYRLLETPRLEYLEPEHERNYGIAVRVLDCQPFQKSPLEAILDQLESESELLDAGSQSSESSSDTWKVPAIAQPYITLKESYYQTLPDVHDAWQQDGEEVILLEDRLEWQLLSDLWDSEQLSTLQILYWLDEMAQLWEALEPWHCCQSLLEISNLRVDEDQALGLVRLYPDPPNQPPTLQDLGFTWQRLFDQSQRTQFTTLSSVFRQLCTGETSTISELRAQLEAIVHEQPSITSAYPSSYEQPAWEGEVEDSLSADTQDDNEGVVMPKAAYEATSGNEGDDLPTVILPMQLLSLDDAGCTDIGHHREHNEDSFGIQTQIEKRENPMGRSVKARGLYILCDGMGGHSSGEVASAMAVETLQRYFQEHWPEGDRLPSQDTIRDAIHTSNQAIYGVNQKNARSGSGRMGTTLAMMLVQNTNAAIAHVGDSRLYRLTRKRGLEQITVDHEVGQREIGRGVDPADAYRRPDAYQLTQALGPRDNSFINPDIQFLELNEDTLFILCSDGLSDNDLIETHWQTHLAPLLSSRANLDQGILQLIELANELNGHDNITALLIRVKVRPNFEQQQLLYK
jgi:serine/threonine protein phosphatase PrpC/ribosomal protein L40E